MKRTLFVGAVVLGGVALAGCESEGPETGVAPASFAEAEARALAYHGRFEPVPLTVDGRVRATALGPELNEHCELTYSYDDRTQALAITDTDRSPQGWQLCAVLETTLSANGNTDVPVHAETVQSMFAIMRDAAWQPADGEDGTVSFSTQIPADEGVYPDALISDDPVDVIVSFGAEHGNVVFGTLETPGPLDNLAAPGTRTELALTSRFTLLDSGRPVRRLARIRVRQEEADDPTQFVESLVEHHIDTVTERDGAETGPYSTHGLTALLPAGSRDTRTTLSAAEASTAVLAVARRLPGSQSINKTED